MKKLLTAFATAIVTATSAWAAPATLDEISDYLDTLQSVQADFVQFNPDGSQMPGTMYLKRPGKVRFEYVGENVPLVLISGGQVAVFDPLSNEPPFRFPVGQTPLAPVLQRDVDLASTRFETRIQESEGFTLLYIQDPKFAQYGFVTLVFDTEPLQLRQWVIVDGAGAQTSIALNKIDLAASIRNNIFNIRTEMRKRGFDVN